MTLVANKQKKGDHSIRPQLVTACGGTLTSTVVPTDAVQLESDIKGLNAQVVFFASKSLHQGICET